MQGCGPECQVAGCDRRPEVGSECRAHYMQRRRHGHATTATIQIRRTETGTGTIACMTCGRPLSHHDLSWTCRP